MPVEHGHQRSRAVSWKQLIEDPGVARTAALPGLPRLEQQTGARHAHHIGGETHLAQPFRGVECPGITAPIAAMVRRAAGFLRST